MSVNQEKLWQSLKDEQLVSGTLPEKTELESPWYVRVLVGIGGWLAAIFILGFIGTGFVIVFRNEQFGTVIGILMSVGSYLLLRATRENDFSEQFALAVSFAGQFVFAFGLFRLFSGEKAMAYLVYALYQAILAWAMPSSVHRSWSAFAAAISLSFGLKFLHIFYIDNGLLLAGAALIWVNEFRWIARHRVLTPIAYGLTLALVYLQAIGSYYHYFFFRLVTRNRTVDTYWYKPWMGELICALVALYVVWRILQRYRKPLFSRTSVLAFVITLLLVAASFKAGGITVGLVILVLGFANGNHILAGLGIAALLYFISTYYYLLERSLLEKSLTLLVIGVVMLVAGWLVHRFFHDREVKHEG